MNEDDPTNNVSDTIFSKIGLQLHRREDHPLGILKDAIYEYFDKNMGTKYEKFDDFLPIVSTKAVSGCAEIRLTEFVPLESHCRASSAPLFLPATFPAHFTISIPESSGDPYTCRTIQDDQTTIIRV